MPGPCTQLLSGASHSSNLTNKRNRTNSDSTRKIRVICYDPDATDSSSDEEDSSALKKRIVREINFPNSSPPSISSSPAVTEVSFQDSNNGENPSSSTKKTRRVLDKSSGSEYMGVRRRKRGKWAAEIRHPLDGSKASESVPSSLSSPASTTSETNASDERLSEKVDIRMLDCVSIEERFECIDLRMDLDSLLVNDYGEVFGDLALFSDLPICGFDGSIDLPGFDFELGSDELAWVDEPLDAACCP